MNEDALRIIEDEIYEAYTQGFDSGRRQLIEEFSDIGLIPERMVNLLKMLFVDYDPEKTEELGYPSPANREERRNLAEDFMKELERRISHE